MEQRWSEAELLEKASAGDETAFLSVYRAYRDGVYRFAYRMLGSSEPAEDVTHDCFLSLIENPRRFDPSRASLRTYLYAAARNLALKQLRDERSEAILDELPEPLDGNAGPLRRLIGEEAALAVRAAIGELPALQRETLVLFEYEELSLAEIAKIADIDIGAVKARLHRARARLRRLLTDNPALEQSKP